MKIKFQRIWSVRQYELKHWLYYNVIIALLPVWFSWLVWTFTGVFSKFINPFLDGTLLIFTATLSGASMSFFVAETKLNLRQTERYIFNWLLLAILLGAGGYTVIVASPATVLPPVVFLTTCTTLGLATYFNLYLAGVRSIYSDAELLEKLIAEEVTGGKAILSEKAHAAQEVDGAKL